MNQNIIKELFPERKEGNIIPACRDRLFKQLFANSNHIENLEYFISIVLNIHYEEIKGKVSLLYGELPVLNYKSKLYVVDIVSELINSNRNTSKINLEVNLDKDKTLEKSGLYASMIYSNGLKVGDNYKKVPSFLQVSLDYYDINTKNPRIVKRLFLKDETGEIIYNKFELRHINIAKAKKVWYDDSISEQEENIDLIRLCALLGITKILDFKKCLEEIEMDENIKKNIIKTVEDYNKDDNSWLELDEERDNLMMYNAGITAAEERGIEQGTKNSLLKIAKKMLIKKAPISEILDLTGLSKEEIKSLM